jgi:hypothetical protein
VLCDPTELGGAGYVLGALVGNCIAAGSPCGISSLGQSSARAPTSAERRGNVRVMAAEQGERKEVPDELLSDDEAIELVRREQIAAPADLIGMPLPD